MKINKLILLLFLAIGTLSSCSKDEDDLLPPVTPPIGGGNGADTTTVSLDLEIKDFVWKGMNNIYVYKSQVPNLADDKFTDQEDLYDFLKDWDSPEALFNDGLTISEDRFSFITDDYVALENSFAGIAETTGVIYRLYRFSSGDNIFGVVRYILPGSNAEGTEIKRGNLFTKINDESLTVNNYQDLLTNGSTTFGLATISDDTVTETEKSVTISTQTLTENPILVSKTLDIDGEKIGYLLYNSFVGDFDEKLNAAFAEFKSDNVGNLILDLRYNGGGSVRSATRLASMISGQFEGEIFAKQQWNDTYQNLFLDQDPDRLYNRFTDKIGGASINSLELDNLYVIMASGTASASELVINGLDPYINVTTIGDESVGKSQASVTLYDSDNYGKEDANPQHKYAIQPLVYESVNADDVGVPYDGLTPDVEIIEDIENLGELGETSDPLLAAAINAIKGTTTKSSYSQPASWYKEFKESDAGSPIYQKMYIDKLPEAFKKKASIFKK